MKKYPHGLTLQAVCAAIDDYQRHEDSVPEEGILAAFNTLLGHSDIAEELRSLERTADANMAAAQAMRDDMYHWKQRAEAAEAKLAAMEKQEPVFQIEVSGNHWLNAGPVDDTDFTALPDGINNLYARAAPAVSLVDLVPDDFTGKSLSYIADKFNTTISEAQFILAGFNACRSDILRNIEEAK